MIEIRQATSEEELDAVRKLVAFFADWLRELFPQSLDTIDECFHSVEVEMPCLPGAYSPPTGALLVAYWDDEVAGTVAMHDLGGGICEMKHMVVDPQFRGKGIGRALASRLIDAAQESGYTRMRLETAPQLEAARGLYRSLGFQEIEPYDQVPEAYRDFDVFMELSLQLPIGVAAKNPHPTTKGGSCR